MLYDPFVQKIPWVEKEPWSVEERVKYILDKMLENEFIEQPQYAKALKDSLRFEKGQFRTRRRSVMQRVLIEMESLKCSRFLFWGWLLAKCWFENCDFPRLCASSSFAKCSQHPFRYFDCVDGGQKQVRGSRTSWSGLGPRLCRWLSRFGLWPREFS